MSSSFFLHHMEERKEDDEGGGTDGQALIMWESSWCTILVVVIDLLQHITCRDRVPPSGMISRALVLIGADDLVPSHPIFKG